MTRPTHLETTFTEAERLHPDLMERYSARLAEAESSDERRSIMWAGLRETFRRRFPMPVGACWPGEAAIPAAASIPRDQAPGESQAGMALDLCPLSHVSTGESEAR